jgi:hypothetical protein
MLNIPEIKTRIAARAEEFPRELFGDRLHRDGPWKWCVGTHGSLALEIKDGELVFFDHESGQGGDAIALWARERSISNGDALKGCAAWAGIAVDGTSTPHAPRKPEPPRQPPQAYRMTDAELKRAALDAQTLGTSQQLCAAIAARRQWQPDTIAQLARECSLGVEDGKLAFIYETGIKLRWQHEDGERRFVFACGKPHSLWRAHRREKHTERAIITEGETDGITLIDFGYDTGATRVFSVPSASVLPLEWPRALAGLSEVILALDADDAGQRHVKEWAAIIRPHVGTVRAINWKVVAP